MAEQDNSPVFQIQRVYLKDLSLEQPHAPQILLEQQSPQVEINLGVAVEQINEALFEVAVTATVTTKVGDRVLFLVEGKQAGIFELRNLPEDQLQPVLGIACPQIVYPYLRGNIADVITRAGFPPVHLTEVNFQAMYEAQRQAMAQQAGGAVSNGNGGAPTIATA